MCTATWKAKGKKVVFGDFFERIHGHGEFGKDKTIWENMEDTVGEFKEEYIYIFVFFERCT